MRRDVGGGDVIAITRPEHDDTDINIKAFCASNLREAAHTYRLLKQITPASFRLHLLVQVVLGEDVTTAMHHYRQVAADLSTTSYVYVGTAQGLEGLMADVVLARVADGVVIEALPVDRTLLILESSSLFKTHQ